MFFLSGGMRRYQPCVSWVLIWKKGMVSLMLTQAAGDRATAAGRHTSVHTHYTPGSSTLSVCLPLCLSCLTSFLSLSTSPAVWLGILGILSIEYYHVVDKPLAAFQKTCRFIYFIEFRTILIRLVKTVINEFFLRYAPYQQTAQKSHCNAT